VYSLVTPSVLVLDLACRPEGARLLRLLDEVLLLDRSALPVLCDALLRSDLERLVAARRAARRADEQAPTYATVAAELGAAPAPGTVAPGPGEGPAVRLARVPAGGGLPALLDLVRDHAVPAADPALPTLDEQAAQSVAGDALTALWVGDALGPEHLAALRGPWLDARRRAPRWHRDRVDVLGPQAAAVRQLCARLRAHGPELLDGLAEAHAALPGWPAHMHEAAWGAYLSDRLGAVVHAQLLAAGALLATAGRCPDPVALRCALPPVLGAATAAVLRDVLPDGVGAALTEVCATAG